MDFEKKGKELRESILRMIHNAKSGHTGGSLSCVEILMALYYDVLNINPKNPEWEDRDRFIMSKGHSCPALYAVLADLGYFDKSELMNLRKIDGKLQGHPQILERPIRLLLRGPAAACQRNVGPPDRRA